MKRDAKFPNAPVDGWYHGVTRRGQPVRIRETPTTTAAIEAAWGRTITVQGPDELFDRARPGDVIEVIMAPAPRPWAKIGGAQ